ncbi:mucin-5AC-like isoform X2 [Anguilla anguilla]|uniref:mucin-5AC-like isoform X2 n=1 Tax=Anguilla anguilla TaxID=7936 RepID=UPI0015AC9476|nr:mucin-5AC-like isoform X2 [Anguilla anguilla]
MTTPTSTGAASMTTPTSTGAASVKSISTGAASVKSISTGAASMTTPTSTGAAAVTPTSTKTASRTTLTAAFSVTSTDSASVLTHKSQDVTSVTAPMSKAATSTRPVSTDSASVTTPVNTSAAPPTPSSTAAAAASPENTEAAFATPSSADAVSPTAIGSTDTASATTTVSTDTVSVDPSAFSTSGNISIGVNTVFMSTAPGTTTASEKSPVTAASASQETPVHHLFHSERRQTEPAVTVTKSTAGAYQSTPIISTSTDSRLLRNQSPSSPPTQTLSTNGSPAFTTSTDQALTLTTLNHSTTVSLGAIPLEDTNREAVPEISPKDKSIPANASPDESSTDGKDRQAMSPLLAFLMSGLLLGMLSGIGGILLRERCSRTARTADSDWAGPSPFQNGAFPSDSPPGAGESGARLTGFSRPSPTSVPPWPPASRLSLLGAADEELQTDGVPLGSTFGRAPLGDPESEGAADARAVDPSSSPTSGTPKTDPAAPAPPEVPTPSPDTVVDITPCGNLSVPPPPPLPSAHLSFLYSHTK